VLTPDEVPHLVKLHLGHRQMPQQRLMVWPCAARWSQANTVSSVTQYKGCRPDQRDQSILRAIMTFSPRYGDRKTVRVSQQCVAHVWQRKMRPLAALGDTSR
jgi:hypothetical protein